MLSVEDARVRIFERVPGVLPTEVVDLESAVGRVLADDLVAPEALPGFDNSMVDGWAVRLADTAGVNPDAPLVMPVSMEIAAGTWPSRPLPPGTVARILTGAPIPEGADAVVMVEDSRPEEGGGVVLLDSGSKRFIRRIGSDLPEGGVALPAGTLLGPAQVGLLAALGVVNIAVVRRPRVGILSTGDELVGPETSELPPGKVRNSNAVALAAAVRECGADLGPVVHAMDTLESLHAALDRLVSSGCDLLVSSGGVSVGVYDLVRQVLEERGELEFWRIAVKPGKPLAFGSLEGIPFFGLPGNPVSALVTFEVFVRPVLRRMGGFSRLGRPVVDAVLEETVPHAGGRQEFVRATLVWERGRYRARPTGAQDSHRLSGAALAQALLVVPADREDVAAGEVLEAWLLGESG
jgi:molybdopterin molybdotransferase